jgi:hypothetical protein
LVDSRVPAEALEGVPTATGESKGTISAAEGEAAFVRALSKTVGRREFKSAPPIEIRRVFDGGIPNIVLVIATRKAEPVPGWRVVTDAIIRIAVAVCAEAAAAFQDSSSRYPT